MSLITVKRVALVLILIVLTVIQVGLLNDWIPWLNLVPLFVLLFTAYTLRPTTLGLAAAGGFLLEAYAIRPTGMLFISLVVAVLVMLIVNKTILTHTSGLSLGVLVLIGSIVFGIGVYIQLLLTSSIFLSHGLEVFQPWRIVWGYVLSVFFAFLLHAAFKGALDRWMPKTYHVMYGEAG